MNVNGVTFLNTAESHQMLDIHCITSDFTVKNIIFVKYSRTSMARTLMARITWLFRTLAFEPIGKIPIAADFR